MISALRKIENRGELEGATSAVMEMCVDNPREGFQDLFATHPSVDSRVDALVKFAGGRDPGPLAVPQFDQTEQPDRGAEREPMQVQTTQEHCRRVPTGRRTQAASRSCRRARRSSWARRRRRCRFSIPGPWGPQVARAKVGAFSACPACRRSFAA